LNTKGPCDVEHPGPGLGQAEKCGRVKLVNGIPPLLLIILDLQQKYIYKHMIINLHRFASTLKHHRSPGGSMS